MITRAAIRFQGRVWSLPAPLRHHDVIRVIYADTGKQVNAYGDDQGFLDSNGTYLTREEALVVAKANDQIKEKTPPEDKLFSEDLW